MLPFFKGGVQHIHISHNQAATRRARGKSLRRDTRSNTRSLEYMRTVTRYIVENVERSE